MEKDMKKLDFNKLTNLDALKDKIIGKKGTSTRELYELELKIEVLQDVMKDIRKRRKLSQEELGNLIGVKKSQISKIESGYDNLTLTTIAKIFNALNAKISIHIEFEEGDKLEIV